MVLSSLFSLLNLHNSFIGETIAAWKQQGYQNQEEHVNFRNLLEAPQNDAQMIMKNRFPVPRYIVADQYKSEVLDSMHDLFSKHVVLLLYDYTPPGSIFAGNVKSIHYAPLRSIQWSGHFH